MNKLRIASINYDSTSLQGLSPEHFALDSEPVDALVIGFDDLYEVMPEAIRRLHEHPDLLLFLVGPSQGASAIVNAMCLGVHQVVDRTEDLLTALEWSWTLRQAPLSMTFSAAQNAFLVSWDDAAAVQGRFLAADGNLGEVFPIGPTSGQTDMPTVQVDPETGDFLVSSLPTPRRLRI